MWPLSSLLSRFITQGELTVRDAKGTPHVYKGSEPGLKVAIALKDPKLYWQIFLHPELKACEAYMDGTLVMEQGTIRDFLTLFFINAKNLRSHPLQKTLKRSFKMLKRWHQHNSQKNSKRNVQHHYDLSNEMYRLFLDEDMNYTCAYYLSDDDSIEQAQRQKLRHVAAKLDLKPGMKVLDMGCGWGANAMYLAEVADVEVLAVTLSKEQVALARETAEKRGLSHRVKFECMDYRDVIGSFDRIVSIGMLEHVGVSHYQELFAKVSSLLTEDGVALLHSIGRKSGPNATSAWIRKYIFPGGYSPALSEVFTAVQTSGLWVTDLEILRLHYAKTCRAWEEKFQQNRAAIAAMMDERFCRMWEIYLIGSELSFSHGSHLILHMQLTKKVDTLPITRDYMWQKEAELPA